MESITLGQIAAAVAFLAALISGVGIIMKKMKDWMVNAVKEQLEEIKDENKDLKKRIDNVDLNTSKNFLVARLSEIERGNPLEEIESERFWEMYEHYSEIGGNSYIKRKVEQLKADGKL